MSTDDLMRRISDLVDEAIDSDPEAALQDPDGDGWEYRGTAMRWRDGEAQPPATEDAAIWMTGMDAVETFQVPAGTGELLAAVFDAATVTADHWARTEAHARMVADQLTAQFHDVLGDSVRLSFETEAGPRVDEMVRRLAAGMPPAVEPSPIDGQAALEVMREWDRRLHTPTFGTYHCHLCGATGDTAAAVLAHLDVMHPEPAGGTP